MIFRAKEYVSRLLPLKKRYPLLDADGAELAKAAKKRCNKLLEAYQKKYDKHVPWRVRLRDLTWLPPNWHPVEQRSAIA